MEVDRVVCVNIKEMPSTTGNAEGLNEADPHKTSDEIKQFIRYLSNGKYASYKAHELIVSDLKNIGYEIYQRCFEKVTEWTVLTIEYKNLRAVIKDFIRRNPNCIFDVTSLKKHLMADILACCIATRMKNVYSFDLKIAPDFENPESMLYHSLGKDDFSYTDLLDSEPVRQSLRLILAMTGATKIAISLTVILIVSLSILLFFSHKTPLLLLSIASSIASITSLILQFVSGKNMRE
jgi:hypothetical protein